MKVAGFKAKASYDSLISEKEAELIQYVKDNSDVMLQYFRLKKEILELKQKRTNVSIEIAKELCNKMNTNK